MKRHNNYQEKQVLLRKSRNGSMTEEYILVRSIQDKVQYVMKRTDISKVPADKLNQLEKHLGQLIKLKHPSLLKLREYYYEGTIIVQIMEYCGSQTMNERLTSKVSVNLVTQYLLQLLFALNYLEMQQIDLPLDMDSVFLNSFGSLRIQFDLLSPRNWKDEVKQLQRVIKQANIDWESQASHELQAILRQLMQPEPPSVQQMINHPYLLKAMFDFCKQQDEELKAKRNQDKLIKNKMKKPSTSVAHKRVQSNSPAQHARRASVDKSVNVNNAKLLPPINIKRQQSKPVIPLANKQIKITQSVPNPAPSSMDDMLKTRGEHELQELLELYRSQLKDSFTKNPYNPWLNMSEIKEITEYDSTFE